MKRTKRSKRRKATPVTSKSLQQMFLSPGKKGLSEMKIAGPQTGQFGRYESVLIPKHQVKRMHRGVRIIG